MMKQAEKAKTGLGTLLDLIFIAGTFENQCLGLKLFLLRDNSNIRNFEGRANVKSCD